MSKWSVNVSSVRDKGDAYLEMAGSDQDSLDEFRRTISSLATVWEGDAADAAVAQFNEWLTTAGNLNERLAAAGECLHNIADRYQDVHDEVEKRFS